VRAAADGLPMREAARRFDVAVTTVKRAVVQQRETGSLARKPTPGCPRRIGKEQEVLLRARLEAASDATVLEHGAWWEEHQGQQLARDDDVAGDPSAGLDAYKKSLTAVPCAARRHAPPGGGRSPSWTPSSSSLSTKAGPTPP
jgi:hypothetical protein